MNDILSKNRCPLDIAETLEIPVAKARELVKRCDFELMGWGPLHKQPSIISRHRTGEGWPRQHYKRIKHFQALHDQGRVTMCQGRDGDFFILYAFPTKAPVRRNPYFTHREIY